MRHQPAQSPSPIVTESNGCAVFCVQFTGLAVCVFSVLFFPIGILFGILVIAAGSLLNRTRYLCGRCGTATIRTAQICGACKSPLFLKPASPVVVILIWAALAVLAGAIAAMYSKL